jgi:hypothetical protein
VCTTIPSSKSRFAFAVSAAPLPSSTASPWLSSHTPLSRTNCAHKYRNVKTPYRYLPNWPVVWKNVRIKCGTQICSLTETANQGRDSIVVLSACCIVIGDANILWCNAYTNACLHHWRYVILQ